MSTGLNYYKYDGEKNKFNKIEQTKDSLSRIENQSIWTKRVNCEHSIVVNSFQDEIYLVGNEMLNEGVLPTSLLSRPVQDKAETPSHASFILAPSYKCNMSCVYCYQQSDKTLSKTQITMEKYEAFKKFFLDNKGDFETYDLQLFGGEPLLIENKDIVLDMFKLAKEHHTKLSFTTNGLTLPEYMKTLIVYRKFVGVVATTIDGLTDSHLERRFSTIQDVNSQLKMKETIKILLDVGIEILVSINIDKKNIMELEGVIRELQAEGFFDYKNFKFDVGRVDDRLFETGYPEILDEVEIVKALNQIDDLPKNVKAAFIKSGYNLLKKVGLDYGQNENRGKHQYCWSVNSKDKVFYVDNDLDVFRCTYTVGRKDFKIGKVGEAIDDHEWFNHGGYQYDACLKCEIGGYCSGGCRLSYLTDKERQCEWEKASFNKLMSQVILPNLNLEL